MNVTVNGPVPSKVYFPVPGFWSNSFAKLSYVKLFPSSSAKAPPTAKLTASFSFEISVCSFALVAFVKMPLSPLSAEIVIPASISKTIKKYQKI